MYNNKNDCNQEDVDNFMDSMKTHNDNQYDWTCNYCHKDHSIETKMYCLEALTQARKEGAEETALTHKLCLEIQGEQRKTLEKENKMLINAGVDTAECVEKTQDRIKALEGKLEEAEKALKSRFNDWLIRGSQITELEGKLREAEEETKMSYVQIRRYKSEKSDLQTKLKEYEDANKTE